MERLLVVNADDFGQSRSVNRGIVAGHERGIVTSASLMVRWPAAAEAAGYARQQPELSVGLHLDLGEWVYRDGTWVALYEVVPVGDGDAVAGEVAAQMEAFQQLMGCDPTHIDSHQHVHRREPARSVVIDVARRLGVPLRGCTEQVGHCGDFYGQTLEGNPFPDGISVERLVRIIETLHNGCTELGCHPGEGDDLTTMYRRERSQEVQVLCDPRVREAVRTAGVQLCSFRALRATMVACAH